ncbi:ankyrin repeat domain-containing protein 9-like [Megalops cyprinoides]|uniref:ankyrin repeat domain-containing protein 9-like n=1 Tax=Megalops cyprinoides TaxID=118141 RepID=UPI001865438A|nr:ankyrin repeat domain-containing protein 9-like [Megalops cyprinoides]
MMSANGTGKLVRHKYLPYVYYQAIRDLQPVWKLEDMRTMETFYWDKQHRRRTFTPSEALLYAIIHDHQAYAQYLLSHYAEKALAMPGKYFCHVPASVPHLMMAVRYNRREILGLVLQVARRVPSLRACLNQGGCFNSEDNKTPLHLACELVHLDAIILLLCNGASPQVEDQNGMTPLDVILDKLQDSEVNVGGKKQCLNNLLMFLPEVRFKMKRTLEEDRVRWTNVLGEETLNYLVGCTPAPLFLIAMQKILQLLPSDKLLESLHQLPIPSSLKSLPVPGNQLEPLRPKD